MSAASDFYGGISPIQRLEATSGTGTFTPVVSGGSWILVTACAGGGGGGKYGASAGGGGGAGAQVFRFPLWITGPVSWAVGAGGPGATSTSGTSGGNTTVGQLILPGGTPGGTNGALGSSPGVTGATGYQQLIGAATVSSGGWTGLGTGPTAPGSNAAANNYGGGGPGSVDAGVNGYNGAGGYLLIEELGR